MSSLRLQPTKFGNQNLILQKLTHEAIAIHSVRAFYLPRAFVALDNILGEDRLSKFEHAYPVDIYLESVDGFEGQGEFASKFGLQIQNSAKIQISKQEWSSSVSKFGQTILPDRPAEGDLIHIPMTGGLFEITYVFHQTPFYQLNQYYAWKLSIELFRYASEKIQTGNSEVDVFESLHSFDTSVNNISDVISDNVDMVDKADDLVFDRDNPFGSI